MPRGRDQGPATSLTEIPRYPSVIRTRQISRGADECNHNYYSSRRFASQGLEPKLPRTMDKHLLLLLVTPRTHNYLHAMNPPHSTFLWAHLPTDPAHGTLNGGGHYMKEGRTRGRNPSGGISTYLQKSLPMCFGLWEAGVTNISGVSNP